ncbi:c-type cytochrome biogenesis protein CcmI [Terasakiella sp. A23]|uniref:c-type cytochrome biogenesis protein CcmI n=1 Tax=Terasakiella sp. FCG-A23 TaxID=3080561 RepID=UPI00295584EA|nr:c-type cytochrome biogenesis protein CcmI [Terasakiella sp. A23]MDV7339654.1 c-type cytochrome biogenesis protein CcmI [Terasakiella sp. A23]
MSFWIAVVLLSAVTLFLLAAPLWRKREEEADRADFELNVFKDQLKELDRDLERNLISEEEAETARIEIQRHLLAADDKRKKHAANGAGVGAKSLAVYGGIAIAVIGGSFLLYGKLGMPGYGDVPYASRDIQREHQVASGSEDGMASEIAALKKHLENEPKDVEAWLLLGRTMRTVGRKDEAMDAFRGAVQASGRHPAVLADYAEARIYADEGVVKKETIGALMESLQGDPTQMKARFYLGYAKARVEDFEGAIQTWIDLIAMAPPEAPWLKQVHEQIKLAAQAGELDVADFKPSASAENLAKQLALEWEQEKKALVAEAEAGPTREQMKQAQDMTDEERADMIRGMVDRLADRLKEEPNDIEGWKRLANAYQVLGEKKLAIEARNKVKELSGG